jgi:hypothetical protein
MTAAVPYLMASQLVSGLYSSKRAGDAAENASEDALKAEQERKDAVKAKDALRETGRAEKQTQLKVKDPLDKSNGFATTAKSSLTIPTVN